MDDRKMLALLNRLDDDLLDQEVDKILEGVEIDMNSIQKKARQKLNKHNKTTKVKRRKRFSYVAAACLCLVGASVYASDISETIKSFMNKTPVYDTVVEGDAYYLKNKLILNSDIAIDSAMVSEGNLEMTISTNLGFSELGEIQIIAQDGSEYYLGGYSEEESGYYLHFMNKAEGNYQIKPFKDFKLVIGVNSFGISLEKAKGIDISSEIYTSQVDSNQIKGVDIAAKVIEGDGKSKIQLAASFEDHNLQLMGLGRPIQAKVEHTFEDRGEEGMFGSGTSSSAESLYITDESNQQYKLEKPKDAKGSPVTTFDITNDLKGKNLTLHIPAIIAMSNQKIEPISLNIPKTGEEALNKEIDFTTQKAVLKKVTRLSATSAEVEFELNTGTNKNIDLRSFDFYSSDIKKLLAIFDRNKAVVTIEFFENIDTTQVQISMPNFVMNGNWMINITR